MRTFIFALAAIVLASCVIGQAGAADRLPAFDIARNCKAETAGLGFGSGVEGCTKEETDAKPIWPNAGLSLAHPTKNSASARVAVEVSRATSSF